MSTDMEPVEVDAERLSNEEMAAELIETYRSLCKSGKRKVEVGDQFRNEGLKELNDARAFLHTIKLYKPDFTLTEEP